MSQDIEHVKYDPESDLLTPDGEKWLAAVTLLIGSAYDGTKGCDISTIHAHSVTKDGIDIGDWKITIEPIRTVTEGSA